MDAAGRSRRRRVVRERAGEILWPALAIALVLLTWELWVRVGDVPLYQMASFTESLDSAAANFHDLAYDAWVTAREALYGFLISAGVGLTIALAIDSSWRVEQMLAPFLVLSQVIPVIAIAPAMVIWFGFGLTPKILTVCLFCVFVIVLETVAGLRALPDENVYLARSMGSSHHDFFFKVKIPYALPNMFSGLKLAAMFSVTGAVIGEFISAERGLGHEVFYAYSSFDTKGLCAGILFLIVMGIVVYTVMDVIERLLIPWHVSRRLEAVGTL